MEEKMKKKIKMNKNQKLNVVNKISELISNDSDILFAYIFGSFVQNEAFSDIDIGIYLKGKANIKKEFDLENELEGALKLPVDVRTINNAPISFVYNILNDKILIKDDEKRADFEGQALKNYFDYVHLLDEYLKEAVCA